MEKLKIGRQFHGIISRINKAKKINVSQLDALKNFAQEHAETTDGKAAQKAFDKISADLTVKLPAENYYSD